MAGSLQARSRAILVVLLPARALASSPALAAETRSFTIQEPFGLAWGPDRVNYAVEFPAGAVAPRGVALADAAGKSVPVQMSDI